MNTTTATITVLVPKTRGCKRCGRLLRNAESVARGIGPVCARRERQEAATRSAAIQAKADEIVATYGATRVEKALEAIELDAVVPSVRPLLFFAVSSNGQSTYLVNTIAETCDCPAGQRDVLCYHLAAATILAAA